jgi:hypothetical protein
MVEDPSVLPNGPLPGFQAKNLIQGFLTSFPEGERTHLLNRLLGPVPPGILSEGHPSQDPPSAFPGAPQAHFRERPESLPPLSLPRDPIA